MNSASESPAKLGWREGLAVYLKPRVLVIMLLGFSGGVPIILVGSTLQAWMKLSGIDIRTIGLFAAVAIPYNIKFLWAPLVDSLDVPLLSRTLGRRRGWLMFSQILLIAAIVLLALCDPAVSPLMVAVAALLVATSSATQDILIDAFRVESLPENEQAAGMASYVAAYRIGSLVAGAGALFLVAYLQDSLKLGDPAAWTACYVTMAACILVGVLATLVAKEPEKSRAVSANHAAHARETSLKRAFTTAVDSFRDFLSQHLAIAALIFVTLFKLADALAFSLLTPFVLGLGFSLTQVGTIRNGIGFIAAVLGGFAGGFIARTFSLSASLWIGALLQTTMIAAFAVQALIGMDVAALSVTTAIEFFFDSVGTVIFVAYLSALCRNPLYTATQFALLTALAAVGRNVVSLGSGYIAFATGWVWFFVVCALAGVPSFLLLAWLQRHGHFARIDKRASH
ncbi:MAG TPA: MFS transporter [Pseudolabrys sp.]|nr:MFS transporter [Pseudolabrys sp.]